MLHTRFRSQSSIFQIIKSVFRLISSRLSFSQRLALGHRLSWKSTCGDLKSLMRISLFLSNISEHGHVAAGDCYQDLFLFSSVICWTPEASDLCHFHQRLFKFPGCIPTPTVVYVRRTLKGNLISPWDQILLQFSKHLLSDIWQVLLKGSSLQLFWRYSEVFPSLRHEQI